MSVAPLPGRLAPAIETCSLRAWPGIETARLGGWHLLAAGGYTRRANSAHPLGDPGVELPAAVSHVCRWFGDRHLPAIVKVTPAVQPLQLDTFLAARGWAWTGAALVMAADASRVAPAGVPDHFELDLKSRPQVDWLEPFAVWKGLPDGEARGHASIVGRIRAARAFALVRDEEGIPRALGLGVVDGPWLGLFDLLTEPGWRRRGLGGAVVTALTAWGTGRGARSAYLQVDERNEAAQRLYRRMGFRPAYLYGYRVAPTSPRPPGAQTPPAVSG